MNIMLKNQIVKDVKPTNVAFQKWGDDMKLEDYIKQIMAVAPEGEVEFSVSLNSDASVSTEPTGNRVTFTIGKESAKVQAE